MCDLGRIGVAPEGVLLAVGRAEDPHSKDSQESKEGDSRGGESGRVLGQVPEFWIQVLGFGAVRQHVCSARYLSLVLGVQGVNFRDL